MRMICDQVLRTAGVDFEAKSKGGSAPRADALPPEFSDQKKFGASFALERRGV